MVGGISLFRPRFRGNSLEWPAGVSNNIIYVPWVRSVERLLSTSHLATGDGKAPYPVDVRHKFSVMGRVHFLIIGSHARLDGKQ